MALTINAKERIGASLESVWKALNDPEILRRCLPNCEQVDKVSDTEMTAVVVYKVGPIKARFLGDLRLSNLDPPRSYTIAGEGKGGLAGFAKGSADVSLKEDGPSVTMLSYSAHADVGGRIAQLGNRLIDSIARRVARSFFSKLRREIERSQKTADAKPPTG